jgi:two-component system, OmpR family, phosphate regulon sensor histidine kinase PhoR
MFWRLLVCFVAFAVAAAAVAEALSSPLAERFAGDRTAASFAALVVVAVIALLPAWLLARRFVRPLRELTEGAARIAAGEYGHRIHGGLWGESRSLARTFNSMSQRLGLQFRQLEADREQLRAILGGMVEGVIAVGPEQRVLFANEAAGRMLEFRPETAVGRYFWEVTRQPHLQEILHQAIAGSEPHRDEIDWKGPTPRTLTIYVAPLAGDATQRGAVLVVQDVTELRRLERLRQDFVANVSHELKTPLSVIKACVEALIDGAVEDAEARRPFLEQVADQSERLHALILDLLSLARIESGEALLDFQPVVLDEAVHDCLERHRPRAEAKQLQLEAAPPAIEGLAVLADEEALGQILDNLVDNAVKYTPAGGRVRVGWSESGDQVALEVEDTGPGIAARDLPRIFERFFRVDRARSRALGGTGLGLAIVKHLAQAMHGSVRAASTVGKGTTFTVSLPRAGGIGGDPPAVVRGQENTAAGLRSAGGPSARS